MPQGVYLIARPYATFKDEITVDNDLLLKGLKLIVPHKMRRDMLHITHSSHIGVQGC